jgi:hypothetical protein
MNLGEKLRLILSKYGTVLREMSHHVALRKPAPTKWSAKEILGHLIDSACNNHRRFVIAQEMDDLIFDGYAQEHWVAAQQYQSASWAELIVLWQRYNQHLARVIDLIPSEVLEKKHSLHNLHQVAWKAIPENEPATLHYFIDDYINHMAHHLKQMAVL